MTGRNVKGSGRGLSWCTTQAFDRGAEEILATN